jgi:hypothetical protein
MLGASTSGRHTRQPLVGWHARVSTVKIERFFMLKGFECRGCKLSAGRDDLLLCRGGWSCGEYVRLEGDRRILCESRVQIWLIERHWRPSQHLIIPPKWILSKCRRAGSTSVQHPCHDGQAQQRSRVCLAPVQLTCSHTDSWPLHELSEQLHRQLQSVFRRVALS